MEMLPFRWPWALANTCTWILRPNHVDAASESAVPNSIGLAKFTRIWFDFLSFQTGSSVWKGLETLVVGWQIKWYYLLFNPLHSALSICIKRTTDFPGCTSHQHSVLILSIKTWSLEFWDFTNVYRKINRVIWFIRHYLCLVFLPRSINPWNNLPPSIQSSTSSSLCQFNLRDF